MANKVLMIIIKALSFVFFCLLLVYLFVSGSQYAYDVFSDKPYHTEQEDAVERQIEVREGETVAEIAKELDKIGIVEDNKKFELSLRCLDGSNEIKPGIYTVRSDMKPSEILIILSQKEE